MIPLLLLEILAPESIPEESLGSSLFPTPTLSPCSPNGFVQLQKMSIEEEIIVSHSHPIGPLVYFINLAPAHKTYILP